MKTFEAISSRRSIRKFKDTPIENDKLGMILDAGRLAPSGWNSQPWKFLVIRGQQKKDAIMEACYGQKFIGQAPAIIVLLGDYDAYRKRIRRSKELVKLGAVEPRVDEDFITGYREHVLQDANAVLSIAANCMIAGQNMVLAAETLGIGSCWVMLMKKEMLCDILGLTENLFPIAVIPMGYPDQSPASRPRYELTEIAWDEEVGRSWE